MIRTLLILLLLTWSTASISIPTPLPEDETPEFVYVTIGEVCTLMGGDGITLAEMYKAGKNSKDISEFLAERIKTTPILEFTIPGTMRILAFIENARTKLPHLFAQENFPAAAGIATQNICLRQHAYGWATNVPGKAYILWPPELPETPTKFKM